MICIGGLAFCKKDDGKEKEQKDFINGLIAYQLVTAQTNTSLCNVSLTASATEQTVPFETTTFSDGTKRFESTVIATVSAGQTVTFRTTTTIAGSLITSENIKVGDSCRTVVLPQAGTTHYSIDAGILNTTIVYRFITAGIYSFRISRLAVATPTDVRVVRQ